MFSGALVVPSLMAIELQCTVQTLARRAEYAQEQSSMQLQKK